MSRLNVALPAVNALLFFLVLLGFNLALTAALHVTAPVALMQSATCADSATALAPAGPPWLAAVERVVCTKTLLAGALARAHTLLKSRATAEAPALISRIAPEPPRPISYGYGLLPELTTDGPEGKVALAESRYSLQALTTASAGYLRDAERLVARAAPKDEPLETLVADFERLRGQLHYLESSISYHRFWQKSAVEYPAFFVEKNRLIARVRELSALEREANKEAAVAQLRGELAASVAPFTRTPGLVWKLEDDGTRTLPINVVTDIADEEFLVRFQDAVRRVWNESEAARSHRFRIELRFVRIAPGQLYADGVPTPGSEINDAAHMARFPQGSLVLTTGAKSTHAMKGRYVQIGTNQISPHVLAHEFGHLLGFDDGYLRGTEGEASDPFGFTFVEWTGILDDLMGAPGIGRASDAMIEQLITAYAPAGG